MTKEARKVIMIRSKLRNKFLKDKNEQSRKDRNSKTTQFMRHACSQGKTAILL